MARYVGAAVATALAGTIYDSVIGDKTTDGASQVEHRPPDLAAASWMLAVFSFLGVLMDFVMARHRGHRHVERRSGTDAAHPLTGANTVSQSSAMLTTVHPEACPTSVIGSDSVNVPAVLT